MVDALDIAITALQATVLMAYHRRTGRGIAPHDLFPSLGSGLALMLALRAALVDAAWMWVAGALLAAGVAHVADMLRRWNRAATGPG